VMGVSLSLALFLSGCSTARERDEPSNIVGNLRFKNAETQERLESSFRSGSLYREFQTELVADVIFADMDFRTQYSQTLKDRFFYADSAFQEMMAAERDSYENRFQFYLFLNSGINSKPVRLHKGNSAWKVLLKDDDGQLLAPQQVISIKADSTVFRYFEETFFGLDRWTEVYLVSFPKMDKARLIKKPGDHPIQLVLTGLAGTITTSWEDGKVFYAGRGE